jgi:TRAP-type C4-dicarboxylate transport system substrate-binding protein
MWGGGWMINMKAWKALPKDLKAIVEIAAHETGSWTFAKWEYESIAATNKFLKKKTIVTTLDKKALNELINIPMNLWRCKLKRTRCLKRLPNLIITI